MGAPSVVTFFRHPPINVRNRKPLSRNTYIGFGLILLYAVIKVAQIWANGDVALSPDQEGHLRHTPQNMHIFNLESDPLKYGKHEMPVPWAVVYSPLTENGHCKPLHEISRDFEHIAQIGIKRVRLYALDCGVLDALQPVESLNAILGLHVEDDEDLLNIDNVQEVDIKHRERHGDRLVQFLKLLYHQMSIVVESSLDLNSRIDMLVVGTDNGIHDGHYTKSELVKMLRFVKLSLPEYIGHVTVAEPVESYISATRFNAIDAESYHEYQDDEDLCSEVDAIGLTVDPYFNSAMESSSVSHLVERDVRFARFVCSDSFIGSSHTHKPQQLDMEISVVILQSGWPSSGESNGAAIASVEEQQVAIEELVGSQDRDSGKRIPLTLYSYDDDLWRQPGLFEVETSFGIAHLYR